MRVIWKLAVIVMMAVVLQYGLVRSANDIDDAAFVFRMLCATSAGVPYDDPELIDEAQRLFRRQCDRGGFKHPSEVERERFLIASVSDL